ncbi:MAG: Pectinesterase [Chlorobi bacterium OLB5]|nr:MAG: Pectinesterase [Chlorobi bacterium OLB5]
MNPSTKIRFSIPEFSKAAVIIYDITGRMVYTIADKEFNPGIYEADFHSKDLSSGIYFCRLITNSGSLTRKIVLLK